MKQVAVVCGGYSGEAVISLQSAQTVMDNIDRQKYAPVLIQVSVSEWKAQVEDHWVAVDKNDFSVLIDGRRMLFDVVYMMIHGTPGEDGLMQGYFKMLNIPVTTGDALNMALTFNKFATNAQLSKLGVTVAKSIMLQENEDYTAEEIIEEIGLPCFVKPNEAGSSLGISKVKSREELAPAISKAFEVNDTVMVEAFMDGREVSCGILPTSSGPIAAIPTEIISENEFFDYEAKYQGKAQEITPAPIGEALTVKIQESCVRLYKLLNCRGMVRVDYIIVGEVPHVVEINTVPGFSPASILPQQIKAMGWSLESAINLSIEQALT
ncbi:MAG: D-alanine--D-alanine ligase [Flavobacteriales bacterium]|nr:D-alanine--D-alanine ligase [Flavobacteriales bacterium]